MFIKKVGDSIVLLPKKKGGKKIIESLDMLSDDFLENRDHLTLQEMEIMF